ncbi:MAG: aldehyde dehydrogenase, partial [Oscillospiraceae bacterium]|nr:aldehyde dehydrogenase [Oscillospiraceae bacterium]
RQKEFFRSGVTLDPKYRVEALKRLHAAIRANEELLTDALKRDLGKSGFESYMCEIGMTLEELSYMIRHTPAFAREKRVRTPLAQLASRSYRKSSPYGQVLIMSPWNYPLLLTLSPLADAIAAGNTAVVKPSAYSPHTSAAMAKVIAACFPPEYVAVVNGGRQENACLLDEAFDYIFFTGSQAVGREVLRHAAQRLTPVTLELGGKSPCIVDRTADLKLAAKRIVFGKFLNCGQTCVAPDYIYCDAAVKDALLAELKRQVETQFGACPLDNGNYGKIINEKHFARICGLIDPAKVALGGERDPASLRIAPTILDYVDWNDPVMGEEIFGPVLPILTYTDLEEAICKVNSMPHPLALYFFSQDKAAIRAVTSRCLFGGGCVNDTIIHLATTAMPFGGVGESGMGGYHGKAGFETFSHTKSIVDKKTWLDLPMRYQPYKKFNEKLIRFFLR